MTQTPLLLNTTNLGKVVVVDIEMTCWDGSPPDGQTKEIIEIGVCLLNAVTLEISKPRRIFIKPENSTLSEYCIKLTGITQDILDVKGISCDKARNILLDEFKLAERVWAGWGTDDVALEQGLNFKFNPSYINLCSLFSVFTGSQKRVGLNRALNSVGLSFTGIKHTGGDDAFNAAKMLQWMMLKIRA